MPLPCCDLRASASLRVPVICLGRVHVDWLDKASFGPSYELGSCTSGGFCIPVSLDGPP